VSDSAQNKRRLVLKRPIAFIDLETTGLNVLQDRIVEIGVLKVMPTGHKHQFFAVLNPEVTIKKTAQRVHRIRDEDLKGKPTFREIADRLLDLLAGCDLGGFNVATFDIPLLQEEYRRIGMEFSLKGRHIVDAKRIYHMNEPRDLTAAYRFYCGADHEKAHSAFEDALVSWRVLKAQLNKYAEMPDAPEKLAEYCAKKKRGRFLDSGCWFEERDGEPYFAHGKHVGRALREVAETEPDYLDWMLGAEIPDDTALLAARALRKVTPPAD
jgi:DNA polymerase-3 subunit epsilon